MGNIDLRRQVQKAYIEGTEGLRAVAKKYGVSKSTIFYWSNKYNWKEMKDKCSERVEAKVKRATLRDLERKRISQVSSINNAIDFLMPYIEGLMKAKPKSYTEATRSFTDLVKTNQLLMGYATDIIVSEIRDKKLLSIVHKLNTLDTRPVSELLRPPIHNSKSLLFSDLDRYIDIDNMPERDMREGMPPTEG